MDKKEKARLITDALEKEYPGAACSLDSSDALQLLIATRLSAQCTDARVNMVTPELFAAYPDVKAFAAADPEDVGRIIHSCGFFVTKSRDIVNMCRMLLSDCGGRVPDTIEELVKLPGVGRKTANVIQAIVFHKAAIAVDTHVFRVSHRIGLVRDSDKTPFSVEKNLKEHIEQNKWANAHFWLLYHGRYICTARNPHCDKCELTSICKYHKSQQGKA